MEEKNYGNIFHNEIQPRGGGDIYILIQKAKMLRREYSIKTFQPISVSPMLLYSV